MQPRIARGKRKTAVPAAPAFGGLGPTGTTGPGWFGLRGPSGPGGFGGSTVGGRGRSEQNTIVLIESLSSTVVPSAVPVTVAALSIRVGSHVSPAGGVRLEQR
jgi:hypothetical protein